MVLRRALQSAKQRQVMGEPAHQRQLHHQRPLAGIVAMVAPGDRLYFRLPSRCMLVTEAYGWVKRRISPSDSLTATSRLPLLAVG